jgi:hypothetical protein
MGNFKEALADFDAVVDDPNATEKVWWSEFFFLLFNKSL